MNKNNYNYNYNYNHILNGYNIQNSFKFQY